MFEFIKNTSLNNSIRSIQSRSVLIFDRKSLELIRFHIDPPVLTSSFNVYGKNAYEIFRTLSEDHFRYIKYFRILRMAKNLLENRHCIQIYNYQTENTPPEAIMWVDHQLICCKVITYLPMRKGRC